MLFVPKMKYIVETMKYANSCKYVLLHPKFTKMRITLEAKKENPRLFLEGFLGLLSTFGPFVLDMYISSFPMITEYYHTVPSMVQMSLASCTVGLALGQLLFGTISDRYGRRQPLLFSLLLFLAATLGCLSVHSITFFIAMRFFQGLAAAGSIVLSRSIAADSYSGSALARMFGIIGMINGVATVLAPMFGGIVVSTGGWRAVFWLLFAIGITMVFGTILLKESLPSDNRTPLNPNALISDIRKILTNRIYLCAVAQYGLVMAMIFTNLASAPFIMDSYGLSAERISLVFGVNAIALAISAGIAARLGDMRRVIRISSSWALVLAVVLAVTLLTHAGFWAYEGSLFMLYMFVGAMCTASNTLAMGSERNNAGIASALLGTIGYAVGGVVSPLVGLGNVFMTSSIIFVAITAASCMLAHSVKLSDK